MISSAQVANYAYEYIWKMMEREACLLGKIRDFQGRRISYNFPFNIF